MTGTVVLPKPASAVPFDNTSTPLAATNVQDAIVELIGATPDDNSVVLLNQCEVEGDGILSVEADGCVEVKNSLAQSQIIRNTVTVSNTGEMTVEVNSEIEVKDS